MSEGHDIYVRAHTIPLEAKSRKAARDNSDPKWPSYVLVFDCETRLTAEQGLTFRFYRFCGLQHGRFECLEEGIFTADSGLAQGEVAIVRKYSKEQTAETNEDGLRRLRLCSRSQFVEKVFGMAMQAKALIVGFNLPFDLRE